MTIDLPQDIAVKVRSEASCRGIKLEDLLLEKIKSGITSNKVTSIDRPWMKHFGSLRDLHDEQKLIEARIDVRSEGSDENGTKLRPIWDDFAA